MAADAKASPYPVLLYPLLDERLILRVSDAKEKEAVVKKLAYELAARRGVKDADAAFAKVMERESGISTTLDTGLSLPHARLSGITDFSAILGLMPQGLEDPQQPDVKVKAVLLFFSPNDPAFFQKHLQFLRHVATLFQPEFIDRLLALKTSREVLEALRAKES